MPNSFPSFSINDGDWVRVRQFVQRVSTHDLQGRGSIIPYTGAVSNVNIGSHDLVTLGDISSPKGTGTIWGNEAFGKNSLNNVTTGDYNTAIGNRALKAVTIGHRNTAVGKDAGMTITEGGFNTAVGFEAMKSCTTGGKNVAVGVGSLTSLTIGESNFACGYAALAQLTTGNNNIGLGTESLYTITTQDFNTAIGSSALRNVAANRCTAVGYSAGKTCGENSIAVGVSAGYVMGTNSVAIGCWAGYTTTLNNNLFIGHEAGRLNEGSGNIFLGYQAGRAEAGSNKLYIHNSDSVTPLIHGDFSTLAITINGSITAGTTGVSTDYDVNFYGHHDGTYDYMLHWDAAAASMWVGKSNNSVGGSFNFVSGGTNTLLLNYNILTGLANNVNGSYNAVFGRIHAITSNYALVGGYLNTVNNQYAFAAGRNNTVSYSAGAIGRENTASGNYSFSVGYLNSSTGIEAMSFGLSNNADHSVAIMIGNGNSSTGNYAYCIGNGNSAGLSSAAIGYQNTASGNYSISIGRENLSSGANAVTLGRDLTASADTAIAIGRAITNATVASVKIGITNSLFFGTVSSIRLNDDGVDIDIVIEGDTDTDLFHSDASTDRIGISTATPATTLDVLGTTRLGDSATNYAQFATDGELTLAGTAKVKKRIPIPLATVKPGAVDPPDEGLIDGFRTLDFDGGIKDEEVFKPFCGPLDWSAGTGATLDLRFFVDTAPAAPANVVWQIEVKSIACDGTVDFSSGTSTYIDVVAITTGTPANDKKLHCSELSIPAGDLIAGGCLFIRLHRDATHASDTFTGDARLLKAFITYTADKLGQAT